MVAHNRRSRSVTSVSTHGIPRPVSRASTASLHSSHDATTRHPQPPLQQPQMNHAQNMHYRNYETALPHSTQQNQIDPSLHPFQQHQAYGYPQGHNGQNGHSGQFASPTLPFDQ